MVGFILNSPRTIPVCWGKGGIWVAHSLTAGWFIWITRECWGLCQTDLANKPSETIRHLRVLVPNLWNNPGTLLDGKRVIFGEITIKRE